LERFMQRTGNLFVSKAQLRKYLQSKSIDEVKELGGSLDDEVSKTSNGHQAKYFVIHDTADPIKKIGTSFSKKELELYDSDKWNGNKMENRHANIHLYVNRLGASLTKSDFKSPQHGVKFSSRGGNKKGLFLNIELIQPRKYDKKSRLKAGTWAPVGAGFSDNQYRRLALLYIAASIRKKEWLVPAFHQNIDKHFPNGHDDPQGFSLDTWCMKIQDVIDEINYANNSEIQSIPNINRQYNCLEGCTTRSNRF